MRILVTGGTGFVGRNLIPRILAAGHAIHAPGRAETGDIGPETDWRPHLGAIDAVIHLAARVHVMKDTAADPLGAFRHVNLAGTGRLLEAAIDAGIPRFVYLSSIKVSGERSERPLTANDPARPTDPYGVSKKEAEDIIVARRGRIETVILRPPLVYGPGVGGNFLRLLRLVERGLPLPLASIDNSRSFIGVGNLSSAILWGLGAPPGTYLPSDGDDRSTPDLIRAIAHALRLPARLFPCPTGLLRLAGGMLGQSAAVGRLVDSLTVDNVLPGWQPPTSLESGLTELARWYLKGRKAR